MNTKGKNKTRKTNTATLKCLFVLSLAVLVALLKWMGYKETHYEMRGYVSDIPNKSTVEITDFRTENIWVWEIGGNEWYSEGDVVTLTMYNEETPQKEDDTIVKVTRERRD